MVSLRNNFKQTLAGLPPALAQTVECGDSFRFEALTLLDRAKAKFNELDRKTLPDGAAMGTAVLEPMHLVVKALLAARGFRSLGTASSLELLKILYGTSLPANLLQQFANVQALKLQGTGARQAISAFIDTASRLLME